MINFFSVKLIVSVFFVFSNRNWIQKITFLHYEWSFYVKFDCLKSFVTDLLRFLDFHELWFHCLLICLIFFFDLIGKTFEVFNKIVLSVNYFLSWFLRKSNSMSEFFFKTSILTLIWLVSLIFEAFKILYF